MSTDWTVTSGRAPTAELREARDAALAAFYRVTRSAEATARAFNLNRKFVAERLEAAKARSSIRPIK